MSGYNPFDLDNFKEMAAEGLKGKHTPKADHNEADFTLTLALSAAIKKVFFEKSEQVFSSEPLINRKPVVFFKDHMRVDAMEKFNSTTIMTVVHFYRDLVSLKKNEPLALILLCVERSFVPELLRLFGYPYVDSDEDEDVLDGVGAICNLIAGYFKKETAKLGYIDLEMSHFNSVINSFVDGVDCCKNQNYRYEISFDIDQRKRMVVELVSDMLPRKLD